MMKELTEKVFPCGGATKPGGEGARHYYLEKYVRREGQVTGPTTKHWVQEIPT